VFARPPSQGFNAVSQTDSSATRNDAETGLTVLERHLTGFLEAWEQDAAPPDLWAFLPADAAVRRLTLVELIKIDLEYRWRVHRFPKVLAEYCSEFPDLAKDGIPPDLVYEEFHIRHQSGDDVSPTEYLRAFPDQEAELACLLGLTHNYETTALHKERGLDRAAKLEPGERVDDFELLARLGEGAFAQVFLARQVSMQRLLAVKVSADHGTEPQTLAQLDHDHIVRVYDQRSVADRGLRLLYMQYVAGGTLQSVVKQLQKRKPHEWTGRVLLHAVDDALESRGESRPVDSPLRGWLESAAWTETVCWIGSRLALALDYAHKRGVLHRDIKPANVLVAADGVPKLADFNISFSSKLAGVSPSTYFGGSLAYMSPEQLQASHPGHSRQPDELDGRSDLCSLGVLLWELLTGRRPFDDEKLDGPWSRTLDAMIDRRQRGPEVDGVILPPHCPRDLLGVLRKCLAPDPQDRWQTGSELAQQLELFRHPRAQNVLVPPEGSLRRRALPYAEAIVVCLTMAPHILAGLFNYFYNHDAIISSLDEPTKQMFLRIVVAVNTIAYPTGLCVGFWRVRRIGKVMRVPRDAGIDPGYLARMRAQALGLGHFVAMLGVALWGMAGIAYPLSIDLLGGELPRIAHLHFFASMVLCGLIAAAYPFFLVTAFGLRVIYPQLLRDGPIARGDVPAMARVLDRSYWYLASGALAPMLGILTVLFLAENESGMQRTALFAFAVVGSLGFLLLFIIWRRLRDDIEAVLHAVETLR
jgi:eukaryotic-like serine/threonine-protein kinase